MSTIIANISSVGTFASDTVNHYNQIANLAQSILNSMIQMISFVEDGKTKLEKQLAQLFQLSDTLRNKSLKLIEEITVVQEDCNRSSDEFQRVTNYDEVSFWKSRLASSQQQYNALTESYEYSLQLQKDIDQRQQQLQQLLRALTQMIDALQKNVLEVKKIFSVLTDEMNYNSQALSTTLSLLKNYRATLSFVGEELSTSTIHNYTSGETSVTRAPNRRKTYKFKGNSFGFDSEGNRHLYKYYFTQSQPVKDILYDIMKGVRVDIREAIMNQIDGVIFLSARHGFNYIHNGNGKVIRIIGLDITNPSFNHLLLIHIGHQLFEMEKSKEKLALENHINIEIANKIKVADLNIRKMATNFTPIKTKKSTNKNQPHYFESAGSKFFSQCFKAYVTDDYEFLEAVKSNFGESYNAFMGIILKLPER